MKLRFCCAIKDSQLLFIELIIRTHIEKHSVGLSPLNFLFLARSSKRKVVCYRNNEEIREAISTRIQQI